MSNQSTNKPLLSLTLFDIVRTVNISTLVLLKLFDKLICNKAYSKNIPNVLYPIHFLAFEYGLLSCYTHPNLKILHLVFDKNVAISDLNLVNSEYYSFIDRLVSSDYFYSVEHKSEELLVISLKFPNILSNDVQLIANGEYSKVTESSKNQVNYILKDVPPVNNPKSNYIVLKNLPYRILTKSNKLREEWEILLNSSKSKITIDDDTELYSKFIPSREFMTADNLHKFLKS